MILERNVFQAKYGRGDELVAVMKKMRPLMKRAGARDLRVLTDLSGPFFTVIAEATFENLAASEATSSMFGEPAFEKLMSAMAELVESGSREFYTIVK